METSANKRSFQYRIADFAFERLPWRWVLAIYALHKIATNNNRLDARFENRIERQFAPGQSTIECRTRPAMLRYFNLLRNEWERAFERVDIGLGALNIIEYGDKSPMIESSAATIEAGELIYSYAEQNAPLVVERKRAVLGELNISAPNYDPSQTISKGDVEVVGGWLHTALKKQLLATYHSGDGHLVGRIGEKLATTRGILRRNMPQPSRELERKLGQLGTTLPQVQLMSPDWAGLIGHSGHLDVHLRMKKMGWWDGFPLVVTHKGKIANRPFLSLMEDQCPILVRDENISSNAWLELCALTKYIGHSHQVWGSDVIPMTYWNDAGAMALKQWDEDGRGFPLRRRYDEMYLNGEQATSAFDAFKLKYGIADGDWHVCLHMREAESRGETSGRGETIRNSNFNAHREAIRYITERGGWVIKMGGPQTPRIPDLDHVIDYAHSEHRSALLDLHLVRTAKLFIGGASGFSYVATSFGVPAAMVNVISCISYLWPANCRFAYKPVRRRNGDILSQNELTSAERWSFATFESTERAGLIIGENSDDEILETVKEVYALADGNAPPTQTLIDDWRRSLALPAFYGSATPARYFLEKNKGDILRGLV